MPVLPMPAVLAAIALVVGAAVGKWAQHRKPSESTSPVSPLLDMAFAALVAARLAFVVQWWPQYRADPWSILRLGDGGYAAWAAAPAALAVAVYAVRRKPTLRTPLLAASVAALLVFLTLMGVRAWLAPAPRPLPVITLHTVEGVPLSLSAFRGRPVVINLWATWCPPCRREMPTLAQAQREHAGVHFVFANQGESREEVSLMLSGADLSLRNVLLDPQSLLSTELGARALPTTAFYDADGRLTEVHMGELTRATLADKLEALRGQSPLN
ncbi:TlpA family protein disulfide reductase [Lysobacter olei]